MAVLGAAGAIVWTASGVCVFGGMIEAARGRVTKGVALIAVGTLVGGVLAATTA